MRPTVSGHDHREDHPDRVREGGPEVFVGEELEPVLEADELGGPDAAPLRERQIDVEDERDDDDDEQKDEPRQQVEPVPCGAALALRDRGLLGGSFVRAPRSARVMTDMATPVEGAGAARDAAPATRSAEVRCSFFVLGAEVGVRRLGILRAGHETLQLADDDVVEAGARASRGRTRGRRCRGLR